MFDQSDGGVELSRNEVSDFEYEDDISMLNGSEQEIQQALGCLVIEVSALHFSDAV